MDSVGECMSKNAGENWKDGIDASKQAEQDGRPRDDETFKGDIAATRKAGEGSANAAASGFKATEPPHAGVGSVSGTSNRLLSDKGKAGGCLFLLVVFCGICWFIWERPNREKGTSNSAGNPTNQADRVKANPSQSQPSAAKPSPDGRLSSVEAPQAQPSSTQSNFSGREVVGAASVAAPAPNIENQNAQPFFRKYDASRDGMSNGCSRGSLVFSSISMNFTCLSDPSKSVIVSVTDVAGIDKNGVVDSRNRKFHFRIGGMSKDAVAPIFLEWLKGANSPLTASPKSPVTR